MARLMEPMSPVGPMNGMTDMKVSLTVAVPGDMEGKTIPITVAEFLIGRDPDCHLCPGSTRVGKRHCALLVQNHKVFLQDLGTMTGTFVNDRRVEGTVQLLDGDWLKIGPLLFQLSIEGRAFLEHEDMAAHLLLLEEEAGKSPDSEVEQAKPKEEPPQPVETPPPKPLSPAAKAILEKYRHGRGW
jgi:pSer/pThr/pTyr-binding forkhead associated (FHA) protein